jgi:AsmA protein
MSDRDPPDLGTFRPLRDPGTGAARPASRSAEDRWAEPAIALSPEHQPQTFDIAKPPRAEMRDPDPIFADMTEEPLPRIARTQPATGHGAAAKARARTPAPRPSYGLPAAHSAPRRGGALKAVAVGLAVTALLAGAGALALTVYAPVDLVRDRLIAEVKARTGRDLVVGSRPSMTFWPNIAVSLGDVALSGPTGMAGPPMVTVARLEAAIDLWPLLSRRIVVDDVTLRSPRIDLRVDAKGRRNWEFASLLPPPRVQYAQAGKLTFDDLPEELRAFARGASDGRRVTSPSASGDLAIGRLRIIDGTVTYADLRTGLAETLERVSLTLEAPDLAAPMQATGQLAWRGETVRVDTRVAPFRAVLAGTPAHTTTVLGAGALAVTYKGSVASDATGPKLDGQLTLQTASLTRATTWAGRPLVGEAAQGPASLRGRLTLAGGKGSLTDANMQMTGLQASGVAGVDLTAQRPRVTGTIRVADADLGRLGTLRLAEAVVRAQPAEQARPLTPPAPKPAQRPQSIEDLLKADVPAPTRPQVRGSTARDGWSDDVIDLSVLGLLDADVRLAFTRVAAPDGGLQAGPGNVAVALTNRVARVTIDDLTIFEGKVRGTITLDAAAARPTLAVNLTGDNVALQPLLRAAGTDGLDGRARIVVAVTSSGRTERQFIDALAGRAEVTAPRGAIVGVDVSGELAGIPQGRMPRFERDPAKRTDFTDLGASVTIAKGIADNRDFRITTRDARAVGSGQIALGARTIDFTLRPKITAALQAPAGLGGGGLDLSKMDLPVRITGPLDQPTVAADVADAFKNPGAIVDAVKTLDQKQVQDTVKGVLSGDPQATGKARDFLNNLLKR